jgi:hypothetical protein
MHTPQLQYCQNEEHEAAKAPFVRGGKAIRNKKARGYGEICSITLQWLASRLLCFLQIEETSL